MGQGLEEKTDGTVAMRFLVWCATVGKTDASRTIRDFCVNNLGAVVLMKVDVTWSQSRNQQGQ